MTERENKEEDFSGAMGFPRPGFKLLAIKRLPASLPIHITTNVFISATST
jgi:hypothetical protein